MGSYLYAHFQILFPWKFSWFQWIVKMIIYSHLVAYGIFMYSIFMRNISNLFHYIFLWRLIHQFLFKFFEKNMISRNKKNVSFPQMYWKQIKNSPKDKRAWFIPAISLLLYHLNKAYCLENNWNSHENLLWEQWLFD